MSIKPKRRSTGSLISWSTLATAQPGTAVYTEMVRWAQRIRDFDSTVYVTLHHEPEAGANINYGTATDYLAAWRRWVTVFREQGATNAKFMWIMTDQSFWLPSSDRRAAASWYPGDEWVDGIASDAYNWHNCRPNISNPWKSLETIIDPQRRVWLIHQSEELWLTEYATADDPDDPTRKAQWYRDAQALFKTPDFSVYDGVMLFEPSYDHPTCNWRADANATTSDAWRQWGLDPYYGG
jgi:hypothetical protein